MVAADLHMHSTASDGCFTPHEIIQAAAELGLQCVSITDHDSLEAHHELAGEELPLALVPGIEMTTQHDSRDIHLLGYFIDHTNAALQQVCELTRSWRAEKALHIAQNLERAGFDVHPTQLAESGVVLNRTAIARELVRTGAVKSVPEAFKKLIGTASSYYYSNQKHIETCEAIAIVREAGGCPFIAHPAQYKVVDLIVPLKREGLFGVEAYHSCHTPEQSAELVKLAKENGLAVSGGSDWHGDATHGATLGCAGLDTEGLREFLEACDPH